MSLAHGIDEWMIVVQKRRIKAVQRLYDRSVRAAKIGFLPMARLYRRSLTRTRFIGITGSCGKTTTKFLIGAVLNTRYVGLVSPRGRNRAGGMLRTLFKLRRRHAFCVAELGAFGPGTLDELLGTLEPDVGVVTNVGSDHLSAFGGLDEVAREKRKLPLSLPADGCAVLNGDDARVHDMASHTLARVLLFGCASHNDLIAENVSSRWPERLTFQIAYRGSRFPVRTQLCGEHWVYAVLAALGVGLTMGVPLEESIDAVLRVPPFSRRMQPFSLGSDIAWIRDDWKASSWTVPAALRFLESARARRRILVLGQVSDDRTRPSRLYPRIVREARSVADEVCLFGRWAHHGLKARQGEDDRSILVFPSARELVPYLERTLRRGDLLYVKASGRHDPSIDAAFSGRFWSRAGQLSPVDSTPGPLRDP